jgi:hypothetical protein
MDTWPGHGVPSIFLSLYSSVSMNVWTYIRRSYISRLLHQLSEEYNLSSLIYKLCSSIITDECFIVSCSDERQSSKDVWT